MIVFKTKDGAKHVGNVTCTTSIDDHGWPFIDAVLYVDIFGNTYDSKDVVEAKNDD